MWPWCQVGGQGGPAEEAAGAEVWIPGHGVANSKLCCGKLVEGVRNLRLRRGGGRRPDWKRGEHVETLRQDEVVSAGIRDAFRSRRRLVDG